MEAEKLARLFHKTYERLASSFGYETRPDTKEFDPKSPNGKLMIAVCREVISQVESETLDRAVAAIDKLMVHTPDEVADLNTHLPSPLDEHAYHEALGFEQAVEQARANIHALKNKDE